MNVNAPLPGRDDDTFGVGFGWAHVSPRAAALDRDTCGFGGSPYPVQGSAEQFIELTYQLQLAPWWPCSPTCNTCSIPAVASPTRTIRRT